jgi:hypothetical protein
MAFMRRRALAGVAGVALAVANGPAATDINVCLTSAVMNLVNCTNPY